MSSATVPEPAATTFSVIVPVKPPARGKSRLVGLADEARAELAAGFALDTVAAALDVPQVEGVLVVTDDFRFAARLKTLGVAVIPDGVTQDLNGTLLQAVAEATRRWPTAQPVALCADLPALNSEELAQALASLPARTPAFVSDHAGTGTVLYSAPAGRFESQFGHGSAAAHRHLDAVELVGDWPRLRRDVDDLADLAQALALGVGPATAAAASSLSANLD